MASQLKGHKWFAALFDRIMAPAEKSFLKEARQHAAGGARGRVLEIGCGTGANFAFYTSAATAVIATEPDPYMLERARSKLTGASQPIEIRQAPAEELPFDDASFDTVVDTINMCTIGDLPRALSEISRVLRPGGELRFFEHVRYQNPLGALTQDLVTPIWKWFGAGCHPNRDVARAIGEAGFEITHLQRSNPVPPVPPMVFSRPHIMGVAVRP
jgi:ubiquinone/menaquinone biosynthesis C-methylase UbiE